MFSLAARTTLAQSITLAIDGLSGKTGIVQIAVYNRSEHFLDRDTALHTTQIELSAGADSVGTTIDVDPGEYAVAIFLDENKNGKLDTRIFGIPKERYGFSNNPSLRFRPPHYEEVAFTVSESDLLQRITLR